MRKLAALLCLFTLAACGQSAPTDATPANTDGPVVIDSTRDMPDWLLALRTTEGGTVHFNQRTITRENGFADIWLQVRYGRPQAWDASDETTERIIRYEVERMHYRFNCAEGTFVIVERQIMGANEEVVARDEPAQVYRAAPNNGVASHMLRVACNAS